MAQITVVYKDFEEMKAVARELLKDELEGGNTVVQSAVDPKTVHTPEASASAVTPTAPVMPQQPVMPQTTVPTTEPTYPAEELQAAAVTLVDKGMMAQLQGLLQQFGVNSLPELPSEKYGAFATALRGMGAQI